MLKLNICYFVNTNQTSVKLTLFEHLVIYCLLKQLYSYLLFIDNMRF